MLIKNKVNGELRGEDKKEIRSGIGADHVRA